MGVKVRQKGGKWYVFINHNGQRKAKCVGDKRAAEEVRRKLEAKLTLGEFKLEDKAPLPTFGAYAERWLRTYAHIHGVLYANPAARIGRFLRRTKDRRADVNPLTREEVACLLDAARQHVPRYHPLFLCAVRTGMRMGELLGLQWWDIDFHSRFIEVRRAIVRGKVVPTKSGKIRRIDMSQQLTATLKELWVRRKEETLRKGWGEVPEWVFVNEGGRLLDPNNVRKRVFYRCLEKAGIRRVRFHDLRHTFASLLIAQNESPKKIQELLGHHSIQVTMDIYGHLYAEENRKVIDSLDDIPVGQGSTTKRNPRATALSSATGTYVISH
jgi:integrase